MKKLHRTFTLLELLIVLAVIAILAGILLPSLLDARRKGRMIICVNRQKQIGASIILYANDFNEYAYGGSEWAIPLMQESIVEPYRSSGKIEWANAPLGQGYLKKEEILFCPEARISNLPEAAAYGIEAAGTIQGEEPFKFTTIGTTENLDQPTPRTPISFKKWLTPSNSVLGGDSGIISADSNDEYSHFSEITKDVHSVNMRHKNNANILLADGHVKSVDRELQDCYIYNIRGSVHKDEKFSVAIKNQAKYTLSD